MSEIEEVDVHTIDNLEEKLYWYKGVCTNVVDGDTIDVDLDVGFRHRTEQRLRLKRIDAPETWRPSSEEERIAGEAATLFVEDLILEKEIYVRTYKTDSWGRYLGEIYVQGKNLSDKLVKVGHAVWWP